MRFRRSLSVLLIVTFCATFALGQGAKVRSQFETLGDEDADHPQAREQWFLHGRRIPGQSAAALRYRAHLQKMQLRAARRAALQDLTTNFQGSSSTSSWTPLGPAPLASDASGVGFQDYGWVSGRATAIAIDPADATGNTVYVGGAYGGLWRSQNAASGSFGNASGVTWIPLIENQATLSIGAIALQPGNATGMLSNVIVAGTGEANSSGDSYYGLGILRSADGGNSWNLVSSANAGLSFAGLGAARIAFSTVQTNSVVAAMATSPVGADDGLITPGTQRGLYTSTNAGQTWSFEQLTDPGGVAVSPSTSATSVAYNATAGKFFAAVRYHGFYSSADGLTWTRLGSQPGGTLLSTTACPANYTTVNPLCPIYRGEITIVPGRNEMYVWYVDGNEVDRGIFRSTDGGATWTQISETGITSCGDSVGCGTQQGSYNLELAAVPNGSTATDLYAGAINLFKCTLNTTATTTCSQGSWLNLTHVYGCSNPGAPAHVHPDQHDIRFTVVNGKDMMYFANDGGVYRALDGYLGLANGSCTGTNQFDSLNQTLGSMTQFVWFSQDPTNANILLGGTQDNGSPATTSSQSSTQWGNVNAGDGGYNTINPSNPSEWFTANTGVSIQRCATGPNCTGIDFDPVVNASNVGGDSSAFYLPYLLDPQNTGEMVVGTCRVWRGTSSGAGFAALSNNFDTNSSSVCASNSINFVRSLAAGGPKDTNGFSNVIYAGTDGFGVGTAPAGGHIWATTNAAGGTSTWADRTGVINPGNYPISGIAIDPADASGQTAFVCIMGFNVSHVWKTSDAGVSWTDFTGTLPNAPANSVLVDSGNVYVATDVGVFSSSTSSAAWAEVGPSPSSGQSGYLPNVSVTALGIFSSGGAKKLRASTYGRGVWEFNLVTAPDFQLTASSSTQTIFPTQSATFNGTAAALNGYNSSITLSCSGSKPNTCAPNPTSFTPSASGTAFTVAAGDAIGDYSFDLHGVGSDPNSVTHDLPLTLHVVDFGISTPSPSTVTVNRPSTSQAITFQVTGSGSFQGAVSLACSGLPSGANCSFSPSASVNPTAAAPVSVTLIIGTSTATPVGTSPITISAATSGAPSAKTQAISLTVTANPDYVLSISNPSVSTVAGSQSVLNGTLTAYNGYASPVNLSCGSGAPPTCAPSATSITPSTGGTTFTVTLLSNAVQNYAFNIAALGTDPLAIAHNFAVIFDSTFDFQVTNNSSAQTVKAGGQAMYNLDFSPAGGSFPSAVALSCSGLPLRSTCSFSPAQITVGSGDTPVTLSILTTAPIVASAVKRSGVAPFFTFALCLGAILVIPLKMKGPDMRHRRLWLLLLVIGAAGFQTACGGGGGSGGGTGGSGQPGTPVGTYTVTVTGASGGVTHTTNVTLTVN